jgi:hypothetical protein
VVLSLIDIEKAGEITDDWDGDNDILLLWATNPQAARRLYVNNPKIFNDDLKRVLLATGAIGESEIDAIGPEYVEIVERNFDILIAKYCFDKFIGWVHKLKFDAITFWRIKVTAGMFGYSAEEFDALKRD